MSLKPLAIPKEESVTLNDTGASGNAGFQFQTEMGTLSYTTALYFPNFKIRFLMSYVIT